MGFKKLYLIIIFFLLSNISWSQDNYQNWQDSLIESKPRSTMEPIRDLLKKLDGSILDVNYRCIGLLTLLLTLLDEAEARDDFSINKYNDQLLQFQESSYRYYAYEIKNPNLTRNQWLRISNPKIDQIINNYIKEVEFSMKHNKDNVFIQKDLSTCELILESINE